MKLNKIFLILVIVVLLGREAQADFYFQQEVHATQKGLSEVNEEKAESDFRRKIYVLGQVFAIQIEENGQLKKEYGFDFSKNLYYEADPAAGHYKWYNLKILAKAFEKMSRKTQPFHGSRRRIADDFSRALLEGKMDFPVRIEKALFGKKEFNGRGARLYKLREGPGASFLNFFGWYRKADLWATADVPGFSEYSAIRSKLKEKADFYKIKHNRISDLIITLSAFKGIPLRIDSVAKRRFERATAKETTREITSFISAEKIKQGQLLYFKQSSRFSWNVVFSEGTEFGPDMSVERGENFDPRRSLPWLIIPVLFFFFLTLWFLGGVAEEDGLSLKRLLVLRGTVLMGFLFALETIHTLKDIPYLFSPLIEFALAATGGVLWIVWEARVHRRNVGRKMREAHLRYCPHCRARCEEFYVVCPKCNSPFMHSPGKVL